jgi:flagellar assembly protein FliH
MTGSARFLFDTDFRGGGNPQGPTDADLATARQQGYSEGVAVGQAQALAQIEERIQSLAGVLVQNIDSLLSNMAVRTQQVEDAAVQVAVMLGQRIGGAALAQNRMAGLESAARDCMAHARSAPHLAVRVHESMIDAVDALFARLGRETGYAGRVVVLGEPDIRPGDGRIEWADGGVLVEQELIEQAVASAVERIFGIGVADVGASPRPDMRTPNEH